MPGNNQRDNSGVLFKNDRKDSDKHPDYRGSVTINGVDYWISGWRKDGQRGAFISLAVQEKVQGGGYGRGGGRRDDSRNNDPRNNETRGNGYERPQPRGQQGRRNDLDDEVPF